LLFGGAAFTTKGATVWMNRSSGELENEAVRSTRTIHGTCYLAIGHAPRAMVGSTPMAGNTGALNENSL
jgi:hypothetical protein